MIKKKAKKMTLENFKKYGTFSSLVSPAGPKLGAGDVEFYRDMIQDDNQGTVSYSVCRVKPRAFVASVAECHDYANEALMPVDGDVYMHVGAATKSDEIDMNDFEVFFVPMGTMVVLRRGVWHHAVFAAGKSVVNALIALPERTYKNDCTVVRLPEDKCISFEGI